jgi:sialic acid synthase SpsE
MKTKQPKEMIQNLTHTIVEGNLIRSSLDAHDDEFRRLFDMVNDWVGLLGQRSQPIMKLFAQPNNMHAKYIVMTNPVEKGTKFAEIQAEEKRLDALDESTRAANK